LAHDLSLECQFTDSAGRPKRKFKVITANKITPQIATAKNGSTARRFSPLAIILKEVRDIVGFAGPTTSRSSNSNRLFWLAKPKSIVDCKKKAPGLAPGAFLLKYGADGGTRTRTILSNQRILSPLRLPFRHIGSS
jgi:hypothetical protein